MTPETADLANGTFETIGALLLWYDVYMVYKHKEVKGVWWPARGFFMAWGLWNLAYYPALDQWWSFWGGVGLVSANLVWCALAAYYMWWKKNDPADAPV